MLIINFDRKTDNTPTIGILFTMYNTHKWTTTNTIVSLSILRCVMLSR